MMDTKPTERVAPQRAGGEGKAAPAAAGTPSNSTRRRPVTERERQAAIEGWKRLLKEGKLHCMVNCPLGALDECSLCGG